MRERPPHKPIRTTLPNTGVAAAAGAAPERRNVPASPRPAHTGADASPAPIYDRIVLAVDANSERIAAPPIATALGTAIGNWELLTVTADEVEQDPPPPRTACRLPRPAHNHMHGASIRQHRCGNRPPCHLPALRAPRDGVDGTTPLDTPLRPTRRPQRARPNRPTDPPRRPPRRSRMSGHIPAHSSSASTHPTRTPPPSRPSIGGGAPSHLPRLGSSRSSQRPSAQPPTVTATCTAGPLPSKLSRWESQPTSCTEATPSNGSTSGSTSAPHHCPTRFTSRPVAAIAIHADTCTA